MIYDHINQCEAEAQGLLFGNVSCLAFEQQEGRVVMTRMLHEDWDCFYESNDLVRQFLHYRAASHARAKGGREILACSYEELNELQEVLEAEGERDNWVVMPYEELKERARHWASKQA